MFGAFLTDPASSWYQSLESPAFNPPGWVFGPVWTVLYLLMGVSVFLVCKKSFNGRTGQWALAAFIVQLLLNGLWTPVFFGLQSPLGGMVIIIFLIAAIAATIWFFRRISKAAALLLLPYLGWVCFAAVLNAAIVLLN
mgnify:CR=1 FL=1